MAAPGMHTMTRSKTLGFALPVLTVENLSWTLATLFSILSICSHSSKSGQRQCT